jgi:hypothetical protein
LLEENQGDSNRRGAAPLGSPGVLITIFKKISVMKETKKKKKVSL